VGGGFWETSVQCAEPSESHKLTFTVVRTSPVYTFTISSTSYILFLTEILISYREMALNTKDSSLLRRTGDHTISGPPQDKDQSQAVVHMIMKFVVP
jgi:hypothetical protein